jgi:predicted small metal-binding protein
MRMLPRPHFYLHDTLDIAHGISKFDAISADSEEELLQAAVEHAVSVHHHSDTPELRQQLRQLFKDGTPPDHLPRSGQAGSAGTGVPRAH